MLNVIKSKETSLSKIIISIVMDMDLKDWIKHKDESKVTLNVRCFFLTSSRYSRKTVINISVLKVSSIVKVLVFIFSTWDVRFSNEK